MTHSFPYCEFSSIEIPEENISGIYCMEHTVSEFDDQQLVKKALDRPFGSKPLRDAVGPGKKVAVAVDDNSRSTKTEMMLPIVLEELETAGVRREDVCVYIALGTHRKMTEEEMRIKYTTDVITRYRVVNPDWRDETDFASIGESKHGFTIKLHREIIQADYVIGVGQTIPHMIAGFGGGGKIIVPGCSDNSTIGEMHWMCSRVPEGELFAVRDNAVREVIDEMALAAGLQFIVNEIPGGGGKLAGVFAGHPVEAHREACAFSRKVCEVKLKEQSDIVLSDSYGADLDFWQALKGVNAAYGAVRDQGTVILVTPCHEGTSAQHPELTELGYIPVEKTRELVDTGTLDKAIAANLLLGRQLLDRGEGVLVTKGISKEDTEAMGFHWEPDPEAALRYALNKHGNNSSINVLHKASKMVCTV